MYMPPNPAPTMRTSRDGSAKRDSRIAPSDAARVTATTVSSCSEFNAIEPSVIKPVPSLAASPPARYRDGAPSVSLERLLRTCLLYTSDAADEEDSVDLGG